MSRIIKCDRCGGEIQEGQIGYVSMMQRTKDGDLCGDNPFEQYDFCPSCMDKIRQFVSGETPKRETAKAARTAKEKPQKKNRYRKDQSACQCRMVEEGDRGRDGLQHSDYT